MGEKAGSFNHNHQKHNGLYKDSLTCIWFFLGTNGFAVRVVDKPEVLFKASVK